MGRDKQWVRRTSNCQGTSVQEPGGSTLQEPEETKFFLWLVGQITPREPQGVSRKLSRAEALVIGSFLDQTAHEIAARNDFTPPLLPLRPAGSYSAATSPSMCWNTIRKAPTNKLETCTPGADSQCTRSSAQSDIQMSTEIPDIQLDS